MEDHKIVELYLQRSESAIAHTAAKYGEKLRGVSFGIGTSTIRDNPDFVLMETGQTASVVLCRQYQSQKECVEEFCAYVQRQEAKRS